MSHQVQEEVDDILVVACAGGVVVFELGKVCEGIVNAGVPTALEGVVKIEAHETIAAIVATAIGLDVVIGPVVIVEIEGDRHVVGELVNVK